MRSARAVFLVHFFSAEMCSVYSECECAVVQSIVVRPTISHSTLTIRDTCGRSHGGKQISVRPTTTRSMAGTTVKL